MSDDISLSDAERTAGIVRCDACPVLCRIRPGRAGACDRYANEEGRLVRVDPLVLLAKLDCAAVRPPLVKLGAEEIRRIRHCLVAAGLLAEVLVEDKVTRKVA